MAYSATVTITHAGGRDSIVTISETDAAAASEATSTGLPKKGLLLAQLADKTAGSATTLDPRLTTAAIVELIYASYLLLRQGVDDPERRARFGAIYAIFGSISVPLTFISIRLLRTIHPVVIGNAEAAAQGGFNMDAPMKTAFFFSLGAFSIFFIDLLWHRIRLGSLKEEVKKLRINAFAREE